MEDGAQHTGAARWQQIFAHSCGKVKEMKSALGLKIFIFCFCTRSPICITPEFIRPKYVGLVKVVTAVYCRRQE